MHAPKLVLHPETDVTASVSGAIIQALRDMGLIGANFALDGHTHFYTGPDFLDSISFLGCAPSIQLDPPARPADERLAARTGRFCHVRLHELTEQPRLRCKAEQGPRCRRCRHDIPLHLILAPVTAVVCPQCGHATSPPGLNWRQSGGYARLFLDIWGIHTGEAVPSDRLLDRLGQASGGPWRFFYIED